MRGSAICCELLITILETPEDGLAELHTPQPHCFKTAFPGSPNGFSSRPLRKTFARSSDLCIVQEALHRRREGSHPEATPLRQYPLITPSPPSNNLLTIN